MAIDAELVEQIRRGNREAYGELFRKYYAQIYSLCLSILNNPQDAEEIAQEMFIHAYLKLDGLRKSDSFFPWLKKIAQNRSRDFVRQAERRKAPSILPGRHTNTVTPDDELLRQELMDSIMEAIEALPVKDREVIHARIDGLDHAEISKRFGISVEASMTRLYRARRKLADHLKGLYSIFSLVGKLCPKEIISGGVVAMKIGTSAKVTIGIIGVLVAGFIALQIGTHSPNVESPESAGQQQVKQGTVTRQPAKPGTVKQDISGERTPRQMENETGIRDEEKQIEEVLAWLDSLEDSSMIQPVADEEHEEIAVESRKEIYRGMTREEVETKLAELDEEIYTNLSTWGTLYSEVMEITQGHKSCPPGTTVEEMWDEALRAFRRAADLRAIPRHQYTRALGIDLGEPFRPGGWAFELIKHTSRRLTSSAPLR